MTIVWFSAAQHLSEAMADADANVQDVVPVESFCEWSSAQNICSNLDVHDRYFGWLDTKVALSTKAPLGCVLLTTISAALDSIAG